MQLYVLGSSCNFQCHPGFKLVGGATSKCGTLTEDRNLEIAAWSEPFPTCEAICATLPSDSVRSVKCSQESSIGSECQFQCAPGYKQTGSETGSISCQSYTNDVLVKLVPPADLIEAFDVVLATNRTEARWSDSEPTCKRITCPKLVKLSNGKLDCNGNKYGDSCQFSCDEGFDMNDELATKTTCEANGRWSVRMPLCTRPVIAVPSIGPVTTVFEPTENSTKKAIIAPSCKALETGIIGTECTNGNFFGSECFYKCPNGYKIDGDTSTVCLSDLTWSGQGPPGW